MKILLPALVRALVVSAAFAAWMTASSRLRPDDGGGADIGAGLVAFAGLLLVSGVWGVADGWRARLRAGELTWALAGALTGLGLGLVLALRGGDVSATRDELVGAVLGVSVFLAGLVAVAGVVGHLVGRSIGGTPGPRGASD